MTDRAVVNEWLARYEGAWRSPGTAALEELFATGVTYVTSPWATPIFGMASLRRFWDAARSGPDEGFRMTSEVVAVDGRTAVVRVHVDYDDGQRWRDLWLLTLDDQGRCEHFEEWPFAPGQDDGHRDDYY
jgi:SnoaL-like domain